MIPLESGSSRNRSDGSCCSGRVRTRSTRTRVRSLYIVAWHTCCLPGCGSGPQRASHVGRRRSPGFACLWPQLAGPTLSSTATQRNVALLVVIVKTSTQQLIMDRDGSWASGTVAGTPLFLRLNGPASLTGTSLLGGASIVAAVTSTS
jgi:hypothetical protein